MNSERPGQVVQHDRYPDVFPHGICALAAVLFACSVLAGLGFYVETRIPGAMAAFASRPSPIKLTGNILQTDAFSLARTLPIYGSSELDHPAANRPDAFFRDRPTGFSTFPMGRGGTTCLMMLQKVAAVGKAAHGKKVVIFLSPSWFAKESVGEDAVGANLTSPQLSAWLFSNDLSLPLRQKIVRRLLDYPGSLQDQPLLAHAVRCLATLTWTNHAAFALLAPLGRVQNAFFRRLEYCAILREMLVYPDRRLPKSTLRATPMVREENGGPAWAQLASAAEANDRSQDDGAIYSATNALLPAKRRADHIHAQIPGTRDAGFDARILASKEFDDLQLLVSVLQELGVDALFIDQPFNGIYRDLGGTSRRGRQVYYDKLADALALSGYRLLDFSDHEEDRFFFNDAGHPSAKAWIFYDQGIDQFYHETRR